jgi:parvulin-like peptidyl-prolyl isomerase
LSPDAKRTAAEKILARAKRGEDFAKLANEFSADPGNKKPQGEPQGGLYENVGKGVMVPPFEQAALALAPGQIAPELVESDFGFHIIKLERKGGTPETYDVRHILIATGVSDPDNPGARMVPVAKYVKNEVEREKEQEIIDRLIAANKISVPNDFVIPTVGDPAPAKPATKRAARPARKRT